MSEIVIKVKKKEKLPFIKELLSNISFVEIVEKGIPKNKSKKILKDIDEAVAFVKTYKKGKTPVQNIKQLLDEI